MLSKVEDSKEVNFFQKYFEGKQLFVVIETLKGYRNRDSILRSIGFKDLFSIGYEDFSKELLIERPENLNSQNPISHILMEFLISARENNITMIDAVSRKFETKANLKKFKDECKFTEKLGLSGKVAIHPSQVKIINSVFDKNEKITKTKRKLRAFRKLEDGSAVIVAKNKEMLDKPSYNMSLDLLKKLGIKDEE